MTQQEFVQKSDGLDQTVISEAELELAVERKIEHEKAADNVDPESGEYLDEIYDIVDAVVPRTDDPTLPAFTFRVIILGLGFNLLLAFVNTLFMFRTNYFSLNPFIGVLIAYPLGIFMSWVLPTTKFLGGLTLNPGKFNHKEHALIYVACSCAASPAYALYNIIGQKYQLYQADLTAVACVFFGIVTQCFGYGLAGLCRRYLVRPAAMLWPGNLSTIALLNSLHDNHGGESSGKLKLSRFSFFWIVTAVALVWEFFPLFIMPVLVSVSLLCYFSPKLSNNSTVPSSYSAKVLRGLGSAQPNGGLGFLALSFDWSVVGYQAPITTPLWALLNQILGCWFMLYFVVPLVWVNNGFGKDFEMGANPLDGPNGTGRFPLGFSLNTPALFDANGTYIASRSLVDKATLRLKEATYNAKAPVRISAYFAVEYLASFIVFVAALVHVGLWYGADIWRRFRTAMRDLDTSDIHAKMMDVYPDVPDLWYIILLAVNLVIAIGVCQWGGFDLPWWGVILGLLLAVVSIIPIGTIQAISGQQIGLNVMSEFLIGLILPGRIAAVMSFKTLSYMSMYQGLLLVADLKLGHYLKIPPRAMFTVQLFGTIIAVIVNVFFSFQIYESFGRSDKAEYIVPGDPTSGHIWKLQSAEPPVGWSAANFNVFLNAGAIWGAIGPARFFGPGSPYVATLWGFLVGFIAPFFPWAMHKFYPNGFWHLVNIPILAVFPVQVGAVRSDMITPLVLGIAVNYFIKKYQHDWWKKYAYVMSAAFDSGTAIAITVIFFSFTFNADYQIILPYSKVQYADSEGCAPDYFLTCTANANYGNAFGKSYDITTDEYCSSINFGGEAA
ncbi:OPT oligopeptide transporter protein-domain-containing protein [Zopfochytrium polystomum]|nr:OPT oligopeptide transporter protein-domain-containing protein [Zopfochytrium polystomum]